LPNADDPYDFSGIIDVDNLALQEPKSFNSLLDSYHLLLGTPAGTTLRTKRLSSYEPQPVRWLWRNRIPFGKVTVLAGDGGDGKSFTTCGIAAAVTTGRAMPDCFPKVARDVVIWNGEDGIEDTIYGRCKAAGADLDRIEIIEETNENGKVRGFSLADIPLLIQKLKENVHVGLIVIDPITSLLQSVDSFRDAEVRSALQPLTWLATVTGAAVLMVMHLKKGEETSMLHRLSGSVAFGALARSAILLSRHPDGRRSLDTIKHNLAKSEPSPVEFRINDQGGFEWVGLSPDLSANAIRRAKIDYARRGPAQEAADEEALAQVSYNRQRIEKSDNVVPFKAEKQAAPSEESADDLLGYAQDLGL